MKKYTISRSEAAGETTDGVGKITASSLKYGIKNVNRSVNLIQRFSGDIVPVGSTPWAPYYTQVEGWRHKLTRKSFPNMRLTTMADMISNIPFWAKALSARVLIRFILQKIPARSSVRVTLPSPYRSYLHA